MTFNTVSKSPEITIGIGKSIGESANGGTIILLKGDLGSGKTLLTKGIAKGLRIDEMVKSPTYTIVQTYEGRLTLNHFDLYRILNEDDFYNIGGYEYFTDNSVCVFEWPDVVDWNDYNRIEIVIEYLDKNSRKINFTAFGQDNERLLEKLQKDISNIKSNGTRNYNE